VKTQKSNIVKDEKTMYVVKKNRRKDFDGFLYAQLEK